MQSRILIKDAYAYTIMCITETEVIVYTPDMEGTISVDGRFCFPYKNNAIVYVEPPSTIELEIDAYQLAGCNAVAGWLAPFGYAVCKKVHNKEWMINFENEKGAILLTVADAIWLYYQLRDSDPANKEL